MPDVLVLNHYQGLYQFVRVEVKGDGTERGDDLVDAGLLEGKNIYVQKVAGFEEVGCLFQLLIKAVVEGNCRVSRWPAMRSKCAVFCPGIRKGIGRALH